MFGITSGVMRGGAAFLPAVQAKFTDLDAYTTPSWLSFSRAGNAMHFDSTGSLTWAPSNMLLDSASLSTQTLTVTNGATNILSFSGTGSITYSGAATGTLNGTGAGNRVSVVLTMTSASLTLTVSGTVTDAQFERVTYQTSPRTYIPTTTAAIYSPRYDYNPSTTPASPIGLLIEDAGTNLARYSDDFSNSLWTKANSTISANATTSPDGTSTADKIVENTINGQHSASQTFSSSAAFFTFSVYFKASERSIVSLRILDAAVPAAYRTFFNLSTGVVGTNAAGNIASIQSVGNGWYRCIVSRLFVGNSASSNLSVEVCLADGVQSYAGTNGSGIFAWGVQIEQASFATSYIPTVASSVTRAADLAQLTGSALAVAGANTGTAIVETQRLRSAGSAVDLLSSSTSRRLLFTNSSNTVLSSTDGMTRLDATIGGSGTFTGGSVRSGVSWSALRRALVANNGTVTADSVNLGTGATVTLGGNGTTTFNGVIASIALYNTALPDAVLKTKSTVGAVY